MFIYLRRWLAIVNSLAFLELSLRMRSSPARFLGYLSFLYQPFFTIIAFLIIRLFFRFQSNEVYGLVSILFLGSSVITFFMVKKTALSALRGLGRASRSLLKLRDIQPVDILLSSSLSSFRIYGSALVLLILVVSYYLWIPFFADAALGVIAFILAAITAFSVSLVAFLLGFRFPILKKILKLFIRRILFWSSGLFYSSISLPQSIKPIVMLNPLLHAIELIRHSLCSTYPIPDISLSYLCSWSLISTGLCFILYSNNKSLLYNVASIDEGEDDLDD